MRLELQNLLPEFLVCGAGLAALLPELLLPAGRRAAATAWTSLLGLLAAFLVIVFVAPHGAALAVGGTAGEAHVTGWVSDGFSLYCRGTTAFVGMLLVLLSMPYTRRMDRGHGEFYALLLYALLGVMLVAGVTDLLSLFICLELVTIMAYILAALKRNDLKSTEAGMKYLIIGAVSTAVLLLGIAFIYGATGSLSLQALQGALAAGAPSAFLVVGLALLLIGLLFKVGGVPFHVWIPDVYEGAPTPVTAFLSTASKGAGLILLLRLGVTAFLPVLAEDGLRDPGTLSWVFLLSVLALVTLLFGVLGAVPQRGMKRMLAYSSIGHAGYLLMGLAALAAFEPGADARESLVALLFYLLAYSVTATTAFAVLVAASAATRSSSAPLFRGLGQRSPLLALAMCLALLSLAGVPPMGGFVAKFLVLKAVVGKGLWVLAAFGAGAVVVSLYFYLGWIKEMYFPVHEADETDPRAQQLAIPGMTRALLVVGMLLMLGMGVAFGPFYGWADGAARSLLAGF